MNVRRFVMFLSRWQAVSQIFEAALDVPVPTRDRFVSEACGGNCELESEVIRLLAADEKAGSFLEHPALSTLPAQTHRSETPLLADGLVLVGRFQIVRFIGQGGMGQVYEARDLELNSRVALKAIRPDIAADPRMLSRFRREVQLTRMITHPNVCRTFDIERHIFSSGDRDSESQNLTFLTMELLEGETLSARLRRAGRFTPSDALPLALQMIDALSAAHAVGVIHRDFKPSNVLLVPSSAERSSATSRNSSAVCILRSVVTDFGLARAVATQVTHGANEPGHASIASSLTGDQDLMGTLIYMAPEQFERGEASVASDIYSLGLVLFEMIAGQRPFADEIPFAEATKRLKQPAPSAASLVPGLDPAWHTAISRCLALDPKDRFENVREVAETLTGSATVNAVRHATRSGDTVSVPAASRPVVTSDNSIPRRRKYFAAAAIVAVLVSLSAIGFRHYWMKADIPQGASILVTEVANQTSDQELNATTDLLLHELSQSAHFAVIERSKIRSVLTQMGKPYQQSLDPPDAREVALRSGGSLVVYGSITQLGPAFSLDLRLEKLGASPSATPQSWNKSLPANDKQELFNVVEDGSQWIRSMAGENVDSFAKEKPPQDTTTSSWEALLLYSQAEHVKSLEDTLGAIDLFKKAVAIDPNFALAWMRLGDLSNSLEMDGDALRYWQKAIEAMTKRPLTKREELRIRGLYADDSGDYTTSARFFQEWEALYPRDYLPSFYLAGALSSIGRYQEAVDKLNEAEKKQPDAWYIAAQRARYNLTRGEYEKVTPEVRRLRNEGQTETAAMLDGALAFIRGNLDSAYRDFTSITNSSDDYWKSRGYSILASFLSERGQYLAAKKLLDDGIQFDSKRGRTGSLADKEIELAYILFRTEDRQGCRREALNALKNEDGPSHSKMAGSLLARCGFSEDALRIQQQLKSAPDIPAYRATQHRIDGEILLARRDGANALKEFGAEADIESASYPREYIARSLDATGKQLEALKVYQRIVANPGAVWQVPDLQFPGSWSDALFQYGRLDYTLTGKNSSLLQYLHIRQGANDAMEELAFASKAVASSRSVLKSNHQ